jgi:hypothetical protein
MIIISLDPSINIKHFGAALLDTSLSNDPYKCILPIEQPEAFRKRLKIPLPKNDPTGLERAMILAWWATHVFYPFLSVLTADHKLVVLTESNTGKSSWSTDARAKAGRSKSMSKNGRANDWVLSVLYGYGAEIIELNPSDFPTKKIDRSQNLDMILGIDREPRNPHYDDSLHRAIQWLVKERLNQRQK